MKNLFDQIFGKKTTLATPFTAYQPVEFSEAANDDTYSANLMSAEKKVDDMSIDNIYQSY